MSIRVNDEEHKVGKPWSLAHYHRNKLGEKEWLDLTFITECGIVTAYQQGYEVSDTKHKIKKQLSLSFVYCGRIYHRDITGKLYTERGVTRKCGEFAREVVAKVENKSNTTNN